MIQALAIRYPENFSENGVAKDIGNYEKPSIPHSSGSLTFDFADSNKSSGNANNEINIGKIIEDDFNSTNNSTTTTSPDPLLPPIPVTTITQDNGTIPVIRDNLPKIPDTPSLTFSNGNDNTSLPSQQQQGNLTLSLPSSDILPEENENITISSTQPQIPSFVSSQSSSFSSTNPSLEQTSKSPANISAQSLSTQKISSSGIFPLEESKAESAADDIIDMAETKSSISNVGCQSGPEICADALAHPERYNAITLNGFWTDRDGVLCRAGDWGHRVCQERYNYNGGSLTYYSEKPCILDDSCPPEASKTNEQPKPDCDPKLMSCMEQPKPDDQQPKPDDQQPKPDDQQPKPDDQQPKPDDQQPRTTEKEVPCAPQPECLTKLGDDIILDDIKSKPPVPDIPRATCEYEIHTLASQSYQFQLRDPCWVIPFVR